MRFRLVIEIQGKSNLLPINYQYEVSSWVYKTIHFGNPDFANWLHDRGYMDGKKQFRLFTFSQLFPIQYTIKKDRLEFIHKEAVLYLSFYTIETIENFILGLFKNQVFEIGDISSKVEFKVKTIEKISKPKWNETMVFKTISPLIISKRETTESRTATYMSPEESGYTEYFIKNLNTKFLALLSHKAHTFNDKGNGNMQFKLLNKAKAKLIKIKSNSKEETLLKGYLFDFSLTAPIDLLKLGYYAGFGEKNSLGFGCCDVY